MTEITVDPVPKSMLSSRAYDTLKKIVQIVLPAASSLYFGLSQLWGLPGAEEVVGTLALIATFFGVILGMSSKAYKASVPQYDGQIVVTTSESGAKTYSLELNSDPEQIDKRNVVAFRVLPQGVKDENQSPTG